jgi:ribosomal protein L37E
MPYLTCSSCGLPTYIVSEGTCPSCGSTLRRERGPVGPRHVGDAVRAKLDVACRELSADAALLSEIREGREHIRWAVGDWPHGTRSYDLDDTVCERLLSGKIGSLVADTHAEPALAGVALGSVAAYVGVAFHTVDARTYVLCCLAHEVRPDLGEADVRFLQGVAESMRPVLT